MARDAGGLTATVNSETPRKKPHTGRMREKLKADKCQQYLQLQKVAFDSRTGQEMIDKACVFNPFFLQSP